MTKSSGGLLSNLGRLYAAYGGVRALLGSAYFWASVAVSALCWRHATSDAWADLAKNILPALAGFSIAAYAVLFAVLGEGARAALSAPSEKLGNRSPLLILASSLSHGVVVQVLAILLAIIYLAKPFNTPAGYVWAYRHVNLTVSSIGLFLTTYAVLLVLASILSIYRILEVQAKA